MEKQEALDAAAFQALHLNSFHFLFVACAAVVAMRVVTRGSLRSLTLLTLNLYVFAHFVREWQGLALVGGLIAMTYVVGKAGWVRERLPSWVTFAAVLALWAVLFLVKDPRLLPWINPFSRYPLGIIGISYLVFRCISFVGDGELFEDADLLSFVNYVLFFPTLIAGPIERFEQLQAFCRGEDLHLDESPLPALHRIANGLIKKYVLADNLMAFSILAMPESAPWPRPMLFVALLMPLAILYFDFSGYCDIMLGVSRLMGLRLAENFDAPWKARNIQEFWNRWHITLGHFIRDHVFSPIHYRILSSGTRYSMLFTLALYGFTMMLIALWHGTTWAFVAFGAAHAAMLIGSQLCNHYLYPRLPAGLNSWRQRSWLVVGAARAGNYAFVSFTMLLWLLGIERTCTVLQQLIGA